MLGKSTHFASHPAAKNPIAANSGLQTCDKNQWTFFNKTARPSALALAIILQT